jgi:2-dehydropantoate 2-reductase
VTVGWLADWLLGPARRPSHTHELPTLLTAASAGTDTLSAARLGSVRWRGLLPRRAEPEQSTAATVSRGLMRWYVLGRGSVGCLWASNLARAGHAVTLLVRPGGADAPRVTINVEEAWEGSAGCRWQQQVELEEPGTGQGTIQRLLVATKAQDAGAGVASLASRLAPSPTVVLLQNGLGAADDILAHEALQSVDPLLFVGSTTQGSYLRQPYDIVHAGNGVTWLGIAQATIGTAREQGGDRPADVEAEFRSVVESLSTSALGSVVLESPAAMEGRIWGKLAINAALNPLTVRA